jgi:hypothetical protein
MDEGPNTRSTRDEDAEHESAVLQTLLDLHPARLTMDELVREVAGEHPSFAARDALERAVRDLVAAGLVHRGETLVEPSRSALRFSQLLD